MPVIESKSLHSAAQPIENGLLSMEGMEENGIAADDSARFVGQPTPAPPAPSAAVDLLGLFDDIPPSAAPPSQPMASAPPLQPMGNAMLIQPSPPIPGQDQTPSLLNMMESGTTVSAVARKGGGQL